MSAAENPMAIYEKTVAFGPRVFKRFPELKPLFGFIGAAVLGCFVYMGYALATKPDVRVNKRTDIPPWEKVKPNQCTKFVAINQKYKEIPEYERLRKDIGSYRF